MMGMRELPPSFSRQFEEDFGCVAAQFTLHKTPQMETNEFPEAMRELLVGVPFPLRRYYLMDMVLDRAGRDLGDDGPDESSVMIIGREVMIALANAEKVSALARWAPYQQMNFAFSAHEGVLSDE